MKKKVVLFGVIVAVCVAIVSFAIVSGLKSEDKSGDREKISKVEDKKTGSAYLNKAATLSDVKRAEDGVNIYMFWGDGCPHCKSQWEYLESIKDEYPYINVYGFEVWYEKDNITILQAFAKAMGDEDIKAVPYTVIGDQTLNGFNSKKILTMIKEAKDKSFDAYFDKVKSSLN